MRFRYRIVVPLLFFTLLVGVVIFSDETALDTAASLQVFSPDRLTSQVTTQVGNFFAYLSNKSAYFLPGLTLEKDLLFYGATALLGALMMILVIRNGRNNMRNEAEIHSLLKELRREKENAENLVRLKSEFLNQVSHELRTPLAVIMGYLECIIDGLYGHLEEKNKEILTIVSKQSHDLKNMIERILVYSRLEAGKARVRLEELPLAKILSDLQDTYDFLGRQKGIEIIWDLPDELPTLKTDAERLKELLNNLLQNALKYTDQGSVRTRIRYLPATDSVTLEVADTGIGIPQHSVATIFDPFVQVHKTSTENSRGGIGLGLSIVKRHVEQLKGTIEVESELGKGTVFKITLPRNLQEEKAYSKKLFSLPKLFRDRRMVSASRNNGAAVTKTPVMQTRNTVQYSNLDM